MSCFMAVISHEMCDVSVGQAYHQVFLPYAGLCQGPAIYYYICVIFFVGGCVPWSIIVV